MNPASSSPQKTIIYWLLSGCVLIYLMVLVGGLTRLTHSGLSITDWSFMGSVPPVNENMWMQRFDKYKESPEFNKINFGMTLEEFKPIFLWEYIHRMIGRVMMYVFAIGFLYFLIRGRIKKNMWPPLSLLFFMGAMQAVVGWWMVFSGLQQQPAVSHYRLATHLMSAFVLFGFTFWFALKLTYPPENAEAVEAGKLKVPAILFSFILILQIIYGAFTAGYVEGDATKIRPGHIFNTWPKMGEQWIADQVFMKATLGENFLENASGIQFIHRTLALLLVVSLIFLWKRSNKLRLNRHQVLASTLLIYGVTIQFILGVLTLLYNVPVILAVLHQTGAFFLFGSAIFLLFHLYNKPHANIERKL